MWSRNANVEPMSIVQNQKLRRRASTGETLGSSPPCDPTAEGSSAYLMRAINMGPQLRPPSENAILMSGNRVGTCAQSQSAAVTSAFTGNRLVYSSTGAPGEAGAGHDDA